MDEEMREVEERAALGEKSDQGEEREQWPAFLNIVSHRIVCTPVIKAIQHNNPRFHRWPWRPYELAGCLPEMPRWHDPSHQNTFPTTSNKKMTQGDFPP